MNKKELHDKFVEYLHSVYTRKRDLVSAIADILKIERESVSRRLNGKVLFTVNEFGKIIDKLDISVDHLISKSPDTAFLPLYLIKPLNYDSMGVLERELRKSVEKLNEACKNPTKIGSIFDSIPVELFSSYQFLCKFMYFKWGHYFVKNNISTDYARWEIPPSFDELHKGLTDCWKNYENVFYIWDRPVIWNLAQEIGIFHKMHILNDEDVSLIKNDLHNLLDDVETIVNGLVSNNTLLRSSMELYIANVNIGVTCTYVDSPNNRLIYYRTPFTMTDCIQDNTDVFNRIYEWINSIKQVSSLISGSGAIERRIFFDEQHKIVNTV